jgi:hypothetical protein
MDPEAHRGTTATAVRLMRSDYRADFPQAWVDRWERERSAGLRLAHRRRRRRHAHEAIERRLGGAPRIRRMALAALRAEDRAVSLGLFARYRLPLRAQLRRGVRRGMSPDVWGER